MKNENGHYYCAISASLSPCVTFRHVLVFYSDGLSRPFPAPKVEDHPLQAVRYNNIWRPSPPLLLYKAKFNLNIVLSAFVLFYMGMKLGRLH